MIVQGTPCLIHYLFSTYRNSIFLAWLRRTNVHHATRPLKRRMHKPNTLLISTLLESLLITPFALTIPSLDSLIPTSNTAAPIPNTNRPNSHLNVTALLPECYFVTEPPMGAFSRVKCAFLAEDTCSNLSSRGPEARGTWIWSEISGCALGYYLPHRAPVPSQHECEYGIFQPIRFECATDGRYNVGSLNVEQLPDFGSDGTGVLPRVGRYLWRPRD